MDVRCSRCSTEYEFDDALISERGTTVKCTNCGFQFKIFPGNQAAAPERWVVRTASGRELVYTSLRELQRGIADRKVGPNDLLSRGKQPARPLGSIAELEPFFQASPAKAPSIDRSQRTLHGVAPPQSAVAPTLTSSAQFRAPPVQKNPEPGAPRPAPVGAPPLAARSEPAPRPAAPRPAAGSPLPPFAQTQPLASASAPTVPQGPPISSTLPVGLTREDLHSTLPQGSPAAAVVAPTAPLISAPAASPSARHAPSSREPEPETETFTRPIPAQPQAAPAPVSQGLDKTLEAAHMPTPSAPAIAAPPPPPRASMNSYDELDVDALAEDGVPRRARSRWIAGVVFVAVASLLGASLGKRFLSHSSPAGSASAQASDARVARFLANGARLLEEGDFEGAKEELDKASALAEKDAAVLTALARLQTFDADVSWLKLRLLDPGSTDLVQATHRELGRRVGKARSAVDRAFAVAPEDTVVLRARIDALRLSGDGDKAREWLAPLSAHASDPENAYVLAALDLAEAAPAWSSVIDRLRLAASAEHEPGRASAALVYALVRAGKLDEAQSAFQKIDGHSKPHPLLEELRSFLSRAQKSGDAGADAAAKLVAVDPSKLPALDTSPQASEDAKPLAANGSAPIPGDFRAKLAQGASALQQGDLARAEQLFNAVLAEQPNNTEALSALGDVARRRHDPAMAAKMYARVLDQNPSYLPALLAAADQKWESGDRHGALTLYKRLLEQAGPSSDYGSHASARIAQGEGGGSQQPAAAAPSAPAAPAAPAAAPGKTPASPPPDIDTTDLPGAH